MDPVGILATIAALGLVVKGAVDAIRRRYPSLDGGIVQAIAAVLGVGVAAALDVRGTEALLNTLGAGGGIGRTPHYIIDWLFTGLGIAFGAGALAEATGKSGRSPAVIEVDADGRPVL